MKKICLCVFINAAQQLWIIYISACTILFDIIYNGLYSLLLTINIDNEKCVKRNKAGLLAREGPLYFSLCLKIELWEWKEMPWQFGYYRYIGCYDQADGEQDGKVDEYFHTLTHDVVEAGRNFGA